MTANPMHVSLALDRLGRLVAAHPGLWKKFGDAESAWLAAEIEKTPIRAPIFICGLARSGSTKLLEILAAQHGMASHRYQDFPFVLTPYWWSRVLALNPFRDKTRRERAHGDGIMVSPESPEAMEEMLWMAFFPHLHDPRQSQLFTAADSHPEFERFYRNHIRKLLLARRGERYLCKGNYHVTRMEYLLRLFPDARFIIPVREPVSHVVSLMRQHERFREAGGDPRVARHMALVGHFEFGPNRRPINVGDADRLREIEAAWAAGKEARGWALYWDMIHRFVHRQLEGNAALKRQSMIVRFEQLCAAPAETIRAVLGHTGIEENPALTARHAPAIRTPDYYASPLTAEEKGVVEEITGEWMEIFRSGR